MGQGLRACQIGIKLRDAPGTLACNVPWNLVPGVPFPHEGEYKEGQKMRSATRKDARHARQDGAPGCALAAAARSRTTLRRGRVRRPAPGIASAAFVLGPPEPLRCGTV